jgi:hypothetical protein
MGTHRVHVKVVHPWLVRRACRAGTKDFCPALAALVGPVQNFVFPHPTLLHFIPIAQQVGQAVVLRCLFLNKSLWSSLLNRGWKRGVFNVYWTTEGPGKFSFKVPSGQIGSS